MTVRRVDHVVAAAATADEERHRGNRSANLIYCRLGAIRQGRQQYCSHNRNVRPNPNPNLAVNFDL